MKKGIKKFNLFMICIILLTFGVTVSAKDEVLSYYNKKETAIEVGLGESKLLAPVKSEVGVQKTQMIKLVCKERAYYRITLNGLPEHIKAVVYAPDSDALGDMVSGRDIIIPMDNGTYYIKIGLFTSEKQDINYSVNISRFASESDYPDNFENHKNLETAIALELNQSIKGMVIATAGKQNECYYKMFLPYGTYTLNLAFNGTWVLSDNNNLRKEIHEVDGEKSFDFSVTEGYYYLWLRNASNYQGKAFREYSFEITGSQSYTVSGNYTPETAKEIALGEKISGKMPEANSKSEYYKISLDKFSMITVSSDSILLNRLTLCYDGIEQNLSEISTSSIYDEFGREQSKSTDTAALQLTAGEYYIRVDNAGEYSFIVSERPQLNESEPNNTIEQADTVALNTPFSGYLTSDLNDTCDFIYFRVDQPTAITIKSEANAFSYELYYENVLIDKLEAYMQRDPICLESGDYYVCITSTKDKNYKYTFTVKTAALPECDHSELNWNYSPVFSNFESCGSEDFHYNVDIYSVKCSDCQIKIGSGIYRRSEEPHTISDSGQCSECGYTNGLQSQLSSETVRFTFIVLDGELLETENMSIIINDRTMVPVRVVTEALGYKVDWDENERSVTFSNGIKNVKLFILKKEAFINGEITSFDVTPNIFDGRTYVPLRFVTETLGYEVDYTSSNRLGFVMIFSKPREQIDIDLISPLELLNPNDFPDAKG